MNKIHICPSFTWRLVFVALVSGLVVACDHKEPSHEDIVRADLAIVIDSLGSPCKQVLEYEATGELEYTVHCQTGDRYIISVNPQGRVDLKAHE